MREATDWNLLDPQQVQLEVNTASGRADYLLKDRMGRVLCVLEAKREDLDPYDAEQARGYAENLKAPFVLLSNGREHWFWNYERADQRDAYRIERLPSRVDLDFCKATSSYFEVPDMNISPDRCSPSWERSQPRAAIGGLQT